MSTTFWVEYELSESFKEELNDNAFPSKTSIFKFYKLYKILSKFEGSTTLINLRYPIN